MAIALTLLVVTEEIEKKRRYRKDQYEKRRDWRLEKTHKASTINWDLDHQFINAGALETGTAANDNLNYHTALSQQPTNNHHTTVAVVVTVCGRGHLIHNIIYTVQTVDCRYIVFQGILSIKARHRSL